MKEEKSYLNSVFWQLPTTSTQLMRTRELQETLMFHQGAIIARGQLWNIKSKKVGPGVYKVFLELD